MNALWTSEELGEALGYSVSVPDACGISIDSRTLVPGDLFVAIVGPKFDGHSFVEEALEKGASSVITSKPCEGSHILVADTFEALRALGRYSRSRMVGHVVGITGSFGKTLTKEMVRLALQNQMRTYVSPKSFNNHYGVPLSLAQLPKDQEVGVFEIGMNHPGEIKALSSQVRPTVALITNIGEAHLENFQSLEEIARAKAEIFISLENYCSVLLNRDTPYFDFLVGLAKEQGITKIFSFGRHLDADVRLLDCQELPAQSQISASVFGRLVTYTFPAPGLSTMMNSLGALGVVHLLGKDVEKAVQNFQEFKPLEGRGDCHQIPYQNGYITVIDETYNAAPESVSVCLKTLGQMKAPGRRIAVLGDMLELGENSPKYHEDLAFPIALYDIDLVYTCGPKMHDLYQALPKGKRGGYHADVQALSLLVAEEVAPGDIIMVKGSKAVRMPHGRMYHVVQTLLKKGS